MNYLKDDNAIEQYNIKNIILCGDLNANANNECINIIKMNEYENVFDNFNINNNDYIFTKGKVKVVNKCLPNEYLEYKHGMPKETFPSEHLNLQMGVRIESK